MDKDKLLAEAKELGINHSPNIGVEKLKAKIEEVKNPKPEVKEVSAEEKYRLECVARRKEALRLRRVIVTPNHPDMVGLTQDKFQIYSGLFGRVQKVVKFNEDWHVPQCILDMLKERKFSRKVADSRSADEAPKTVEVPCYSIVYLEDLSKEEVERIVQENALKGLK